MKIEELKEFIPTAVYTLLQDEPFDTFRPSQFKAVQAGLFEQKNILVCTPTGSGKTYVAELGFLDTILRGGKKALYIVPLKALANEKHAEFIKRLYDQMTEPRWVISMGSCANTGGMFNTYSTVQGVDRIIPVDLYLPGCAPRPETLQYGVMLLQQKIRANHASKAQKAKRLM